MGVVFFTCSIVSIDLAVTYGTGGGLKYRKDINTTHLEAPKSTVREKGREKGRDKNENVREKVREKGRGKK